MSVKTIEGLKCKCERCNKVWDSHRKVEDIIVCPTCKSPYWNKKKEGAK